MSRTVVIGSAVGLTLNQIRPFLTSLRSCGYRGDVVLFVGGRLRRRLRRDPLAAGVRILHVRGLLPIGFRQVRHSRVLWAVWRAVQTVGWAIVKVTGRLPLPAGARLAVQGAIARMVCTPMEARFLHARRFLERNPYDLVVLTDVRDVLFQRDPSADIPAQALGVSIETRRYTIGSERLNRMWMRDTFGPEVFARVEAKPVSCVGVTYGGSGAVARYLDLMTREILRLSSATARRGGADTAIHNFLVWTDQLGHVEPLETLASPVATLNGIAEDEVKLSACGGLLNADGSEPSIVHQYDRVPGLARALLRVVTAGDRPTVAQRPTRDVVAIRECG
jgi:hypothetical protein